MTFISYAQNFEDVRLWRAFGDIESGRYLDIGAQDPVQDSVSFAFYERGWRGVHVEPTPTYAAAIRAARPDETVIEAAVTTAPGPMRFFEIPSTGLSTGELHIAERHKAAGWQKNEIAVATVTLSGLFDHMGPDPIHWLKIDVEGMEADVIASWGSHPARPSVLVIEATAPSTQTPSHESWVGMVLARGYTEVLFDGLSRYFVHKTHAHRGEAIAMSPNIFDGFQICKGHFTAQRLTEGLTSEFDAVRHQLESDSKEQLASVVAELKQAEADYRTAVAGSASQLEIAKAETARLQSKLHEETQSYAVSLAEARSQTNASEQAMVTMSDRIVAMKEALSATTIQLDTLRRDHLSAVRDNGRLEGQLASLVEAHAARLADADAVCRNLTGRLERAENALAAAQTEATRLAGDHAALVERHDATQREAATSREAFDRDIKRLTDLVIWRDQQLRRAAALLAAVPEQLIGIPALIAALTSRLRSPGAVATIAEHAQAIERWRADLLLSFAINSPNGLENQRVDTPQIASTEIEYGGIDTMASDEPVTSVPSLLAPHDRQFIQTAYQAILGRAPDASGEAYYLSRLRAGRHKLEILGQLRNSAEGREFIPGVAGLDRAIKWHRRATMPVFGALIRLFTGAEGNGAAHRQFRIIINDVERLRAEVQIGFAQIHRNASTHRGYPVLASSETTCRTIDRALAPEQPPLYASPKTSLVIRSKPAMGMTQGAQAPEIEINTNSQPDLHLTRRAKILHAKLIGSTTV